MYGKILNGIVLPVYLIFLSNSLSGVSPEFGRCLSRDVRIKGKPYAGVLEVCWEISDGYSWLNVCGDTWTDTSAGVACRQLNFTNPSYQGLRWINQIDLFVSLLFLHMHIM